LSDTSIKDEDKMESKRNTVNIEFTVREGANKIQLFGNILDLVENHITWANGRSIFS
jgi:hypothetical protein